MNSMVLIVLALFVVVHAQQQPAKPQVEPVPHSEQHSPGNPPPAAANSPPTATNVIPNANNTNVGIGGNTLTNVAVPKSEPQPAPGAEPKPKSEPPSADHDHDHAHDREHSPGNPKHADNSIGAGVGNVPKQFLIILATIAPLAFSFFAANL